MSEQPTPPQEMSDRVVIETPDGWMIRCLCRGGEEGTWHEFPKRVKPGATWRFNGDLVRPTFTPSMNSCLNPSDSPSFNPDAWVKDFRCHFVVTDGQIQYCGDCSHPLAGQSRPLLPWPADKVRYYEALMAEHRAKAAGNG